MKKSNLLVYISIGFVMLCIGIFVGVQLNLLVDSNPETVVEHGANEPSNNNSDSEETSQLENNEEILPSEVEQTEEDIAVEDEEGTNNEDQTSSLTVDKVREALNLDKEYSKISLSPDGKRAAYIDFLSFESLGNAYIYDTSMSNPSNITELTYEQPDTVKDILWLDDETLALIIGYRNGTVTQGGSIYVYSYPSNQLRLVFPTEEKMEYTHMELLEQEIRVKQVKWIDDNLTEYIYEDIILSLSEFK